MKRFFKILGFIILALLLVIGIAFWLVNQEKYQNILAKKGAVYLSEKLKTKVEVSHVSFSFFNHFNLEGIYIEDNAQDTLAYIGNIELRTSELFSNYWNNSKPILKHISLDNVYVNLNREKDSIWNYAFIAKAFGSSNEAAFDTLTKAETKESKNPEFDVKNLSLNRIRFFMNDGWRGEDMNFNIQKINLGLQSISLNNKNIQLNDFLVDGATIVVKEYDGYKPEDNSPDDSSEWGTPFNPDLFQISLNNLELSHSSFAYIVDKPQSKKNEFDETNIGISDLELKLKDTRIVADTIFSNITYLSAKERCGLAINELNAKIKLSQVHASLNEMTLKTNHSIVRDHFEMNYKNFHDFKSYIHKVNMKAHFEKTQVSSLDIGYFANILNEYPIAINLEGDIDGTVDNMQGKHISLQTRNTSFIGDAIVTGLPDLRNTYFDVTNVDLVTSGNDLNILIPQTKTNGVAWNKLTKLNFKGSYKGMVDKFYTKGKLNTSLGDAIVDLNMDFQGKQPSYSGELETEDFNVGQLIKQSSIGKISMKGHVDGSAFDLDNLKANIKATVSKIEIDSSTYSNLTIDGIVAKKKFDGIFISKDPSFAVNFNGKLDLSGKQPIYNFNSRFIRFDLKKLGLSKESVIGSGYASLNFTGSTIDNFTGTANFKNVLIEKNGKTISMDNILLESYQNSLEKTIRLSSSIADAEVKGQFYLSNLSDAIQLYLYHYLPEYIKMPNAMSNQELVYSLHIKSADSVFNTILPNYYGLSGSVISGSLNTNTQTFSLDANIPTFGYKEFNLKEISIVGAGDYSEFDINANCGNLMYNEEVVIPSFQVNGMMANDTASLGIITQSVNEVLGDAFLNIKANALNNNLYVNVLPSNITIKDDKWQLYSNHDLVFGSKISVEDLILESGAQRITINTKHSNTNDLSIGLSEMDIHSISEYLNQTKPSYFGRVSGQIDIDHFTENPLISASVYSTNDIRIDNDTIGIVNVKLNYDIQKKLLQIDKSSRIKRNAEEASITGSVNMQDSTVSLLATLSNTSISFANQFISDYVKDLKGNTSGLVQVSGPFNDPTISGSLLVRDASLKVIYLGTRYRLDDVKLHFNNQRIDIEDFNIKDERNGDYSAQVSGYISHKNFNDIQLNLGINSTNFLCLNTIEWDNDLFYGYVPAKIKASVKGYLNNITMDIDAKPLKGATFHLPINSSGDASTYDYIEFVEIGKNQNENAKKKSTNYFKMNMNIEATPEAEVYIILDKNTREEIVAKGSGDINLILDLGNSMNMFGTYIISKGKYEFNFRGVFPRTFTIDEGSKIVWDGDPLQAKLNVTAIYQLPKPLPLYPLIAGLQQIDEIEISEAKKAYPTFINLYLEKELSSPEIRFDITQPSNKAETSLAYEKLEQIRKDEKELVSQAGVLLLLGEFKGSTGIDNGSYERGGVATASDLIGNALSSSLTDVFSEITGLKNVALNLGYKTYALSEGQSNINQFNFGITANLFKDRVIVDFGSNVDVDRNTTTSKGTSTVNIAGDFKAQYLATEDGRLRINAFRTSNYNAEGNNIMKGGVGISYKKVFNSIGDFFTSKKKKNKKQAKSSSSKSDS